MKNKRITELLEQIQKDFQTSSENIGKIKGLLEDEKVVNVSVCSYSKKFAPPKPEINSYEDAFRMVKVPYGNGYMLPDHLYQQVRAFEKRLVIAKALGARPFEFGRDNFTARRLQSGWDVDVYSIVDFGGTYFPTNEQAKKYLDICLEEGLL